MSDKYYRKNECSPYGEYYVSVSYSNHAAGTLAGKSI